MRSYLCMVLVCLVFVIPIVSPGPAGASDSIQINIQPDSDPSRILGSPGSPEYVQASAPGYEYAPPAYRRISKCKPIVKCKPFQPCPPKPCIPCCVLPRRMFRQWELSTQVFFATVGGKAEYFTDVTAVNNTEVDLVDDLQLPRNDVFLEHTARYQFRPNWALHYSIMHIDLEDGGFPTNNFSFGRWNFSTTTLVRSQFDFVYQRVGLLYQPINTMTTVLSLTGAWSYQDQKVEVHSEICGNSTARVDRPRNMVTCGIELQKCLRTLPNRSTFSCDNRLNLTFLDDTFGVDVQTGLQFTVPMGFGRWGYARGGYRYMNFNEHRDDLRLDLRLEGGFVEAGIIF